MAAIKCTAAGDAMVLRRLPGEYPGFNELKAFIEQGDFRFVNMETSHFNTIAVTSRRVTSTIITITISHSITILNDYRELLVNKIKTVIAIPPRTAANKFSSVSFAWFLIMGAKTIGIFAIALPTSWVIVIVSVAIQENVTTAIWRTIICKKAWASIVMAVNIL